MTRIQRGWAVAAVLAGALFACTIALFLGGTMPLAPAAALARIACALFVTAARLLGAAGLAGVYSIKDVFDLR